ncbi:MULTISPECIES: exodeoxyribonuclease VII large subunit [Vibrio]|uniref:Exodeoxyribonuclease 7 large subunit n=1 Tax=Vibrio natriegens NBRC 15636 = ATCC 14048 = DSM 759 TaxID=1219067 RepID=A0AAN0Y0N5_VIBNA|nr:exodeoxyribonuclease VII large subunit [Vibrio natriegens]EHZ2540211.1 exodeoxyribonuclease VII large subunit [Vibrio parahaemolyticus]MEE3880373.1 exodeoxyribonuclease VII large subunit [Vibrio sp. YYF0003]ALR16361.1 exodeoxyribonuclease VII large subunit [Vibrio natriegens NBRC 15636 = ATCC 14048 = DSM 759]ANQ11775.1 exodeoxyribonuclease VII large subunit [Vibrio natriegens NBRC 15636 = ATCC 14048 = DSM 759]ANQ20722.1 exodeoxyribonuclease VII large subunit [Vibrio natriegens]
MLSQTNQNIFTVSRLNAEVRLLLENEMGIVWLVGEISNFSAPVSGHWYLTLKDSRAQVKCAMFRGNNRRVTFKPANGNQVLVKARLSLYEPRGDYQLIIESMQPEGDGRLQQEFEELKMKLAAEGLFAQTNKQILPEHPKRVGVITSKTGAALYDILDVLKRRDPSLPVVIYPTMVQGEDAAIQIAQAIGRANSRNECDVLIVGRGGGSLEDLWCFNNEILARTISASQIPIISAVGHEVDVTIADFVADVRAPTPSAAAELVSRDNSHKDQALVTRQHKLASAMRYYLAEQKQQAAQLLHRLERQHPSYQLQRQSQQLDELDVRLRRAMQRFIDTRQQAIERKHHRLQLNSPVRHLAQQKSRLDRVEQKLLDAMDRKLLTVRHQLAMAAEKLEAVSPLATLKRGYSITQTEQGKVITQAEDVKTGDRLVTRLANGEIRSTVN